MTLSSPTGAPARKRPSLVYVAALAMVSNILEWFDFSSMGFFAPEIGKVFFPDSSPSASVLSAFSVFAGAFVMRPVGGILFGYIGDRKGRKTALVLAVILMSISTFLMGCLPTYDDVGVLAPILLTASRLLQGLSVGGQLVGTFLFLVEAAPAHRRGLMGSLSMGSASAGIALGSLVSTVLHWALSDDQLLKWGWRVPFLAGLLVGALGGVLQTRVHESQEFLRLQDTAALSPRPVREAITTQRGRIMLVFFGASIWCVGVYTINVWILTFATELVTPSIPSADAINTLSMVFMTACFPVFGLLVDRTSPSRLMIAGAAAVTIAAIPAGLLLDDHSPLALGVALFAMVAALACMGSALPSWVVLNFPPALRYSAIGIGYNAAQATLGGTAPMVATGLFDANESAVLPMLYIAFLGVIAVISLVVGGRRYPPPKHESTEDELELASRSEDELRVAQLGESMIGPEARKAALAGSRDDGLGVDDAKEAEGAAV